MKLAPSNNPEKESKNFSTVALICGIGSLFVWPLGMGGLGLGIRAAILSHRVKNKKRLAVSVFAAALSLISLAYYFTAPV